MKLIYIFLTVGIFLLFACNNDNDLFDAMPETDIVALEGMDKAYENALVYNDSLLVCSTEPISCDTATLIHYDEMFHQFDDLFDFHHGNYSHNNLGDDHHHEGVHNILHGWMMHHNDGDEHGYEHNMETFDLMRDLKEMHENIHPD